MSGHNKWSKVKHRKAAVEAKRGKIWQKIIRELAVAVRLHGEDPATNPRLRKALDDARGANMPKDTVERTVKKASGADDDTSYEDLTYECYGPGGVALFVECTTDNRNRSSQDIASCLRHGGGTLGKAGSVAFLFARTGHFVFDKTPDGSQVPTEDLLLEVGMEHGADDVQDDGESFVVTCAPSAYQTLREAYAAHGLVAAAADIAMIPSTSKSLAGADAKQLLKLIDALEDLDDVQRVWSNVDIDADELDRLVA